MSVVFSRLLLLFSLIKLAMHVPTDHRIDLYWDWNVNQYPAMVKRYQLKVSILQFAIDGALLLFLILPWIDFL